ncbi:beta-galactosidase trimerization domain-containing protein [Sunxiuqinia elliptica]|uniref:Beta-galactosidase n=1 Tax=Sunxiuqinia elliptica TaxID=655355 RepID=A0A4V3BYP7_9BACT|nr:beta-galactosidase trimerization domain-containing protein [Sunxiuqinia elliptica]TDO03439.1 beta-galactosidase [Sunxiuqinia elliptica]TDO59635.1 beta-galactosidase [Sunxiuqinia elliptica]
MRLRKWFIPIVGSISVLVMLLICFPENVAGQIARDAVPVIGAQVFIEPGQTSEEIDNWFRILKENNMPLCRIRMFESYMRKEDGNWDFSLFDDAFEAADKYGIKVLATLFPYTEKTDIGGFKFPRDEAHLSEIENYIQQLVTHFKQYESLYGWVLINEPGSGAVPNDQLAQREYEKWLKGNFPKEETEQGYPILLDLTAQRFLKDYNTWYLEWIANEIRKYDSQNHLHVNNHAIFDLLAEYDFPAWQKFLSSLGGSAHPSWHFGLFGRDEYTLAMSANSEIIRSGSGSLPWIMTEIQGGNNTYSGMAPFCPTAEEITQWLWITIAAESKGGIFWSLNPRASGIEAGEWALLNFQNQPSDRLMAAKQVAAVLSKNAKLFAKAKEIDSGINLLYSRESFWAEKAMANPSTPFYEGRAPGAIMKSMLAYFEAYSEMGVNIGIKEFSEFDFAAENYSGQLLILSNQIAIPSARVSDLENFVAKGGKLIVDGLSAFFDENLHNTMKTKFPFENLFGGNISEFKVVGNLFKISMDKQELPAHLWRGSITLKTAEALAFNDTIPVASRNKFGAGEVVWIPSLVGNGARIQDDHAEFGKWLKSESFNLKDQPVCFGRPLKGMLMKTMKSGKSLLTVIINKSGSIQHVSLDFNHGEMSPELIFSDHASSNSVLSPNLIIHPEETLIIKWN